MNKQPGTRYRWLLALIVSIIVSPLVLQAQDRPPDYRIRAESGRLSEDETTIIIPYTVYNSGGASSVSATVTLVNPETSQVIATTTIRPLQANGDSAQGEVRVAVTTFPAGSRQSLWLEVGIGEVEASNSSTTFDNRVTVDVNVPDYSATTPPETPESAPETPDGTGDNIIIIPGTDIEIDLNDPNDLAIIGGIIASVLVMIVLIVLILRLLFRRRPTFANWQPPYATMPHIDPNSPAGQRQQWQQYAQNNLLPMPCQEGVAHARKMLLGMDGFYLSGWRVHALRMTQYDMYGRVARSQVTATQGQIKRINRAIRRLSTLEESAIRRRITPVANAMARQFRKRVTKRSAMLPIAIDIQLQGTHGEVRIIFELHRCQYGRYQQLDAWEPEMIVTGKSIQEIYTYTIFGQTGGETYRDFRRRIAGDLQQAFVDLLHNPQSQPPAAEAPPSVPASPEREQATATSPNIPAVQAPAPPDDTGDDASAEPTQT